MTGRSHRQRKPVSVQSSRAVRAPASTMRVRQVLLVTVTCFILGTWACETINQYCEIIGSSCRCGFGCKVDNTYKTRRACRDALRASLVVPTPQPPERSSNICESAPCRQGICLQTTNDLGFTCKCEGTGYYGQRCEKGCPTAPVRGMVFPHECIII